tara:strand:- start:1611 stop:2498 length:888 start_codon:yes stop_codon:yes gene_type:complete
VVNMGKRRKKNKQMSFKKAQKEAKRQMDEVKSVWKSKAGCHTGNILVFSTGGVDVYGGGSSRNGCWYRMDPLPDLALGPSDVVKRDVFSFPEGWAISKYAPKPPVIIPIDWPDYSIPRTLKREFWLDLAHDIKTQDIKTVSCQCVGGHGRTGVQLAILAHLLIPKEEHTWTDSAQLIRFIRSRMCEHEVEAASQQQYIADVCQIPLGEDLFPPVSRSAYGNYTPINLGWEWPDEIVNYTQTKTISHQGEHVYECLSCDNMGFHHEPNQKGVGCDKCQDEMIDVSEYVNKGDEKIE